MNLQVIRKSASLKIKTGYQNAGSFFYKWNEQIPKYATGYCLFVGLVVVLSFLLKVWNGFHLGLISIVFLSLYHAWSTYKSYYKKPATF